MTNIYRSGVFFIGITKVGHPALISAATLNAIAHTLYARQADKSIYAVILVGSTDSFCVGVDVAQFPENAKILVTAAGEAVERVAQAIKEFPCPVIAAVDGIAAGIGLALALACDITVASDSSEFDIAQRLGYESCDRTAAALVAKRAGRARALRMSLMGERLSARAAHEYGLVAEIYPHASFDQHVMDLVNRIVING